MFVVSPVTRKHDPQGGTWNPVFNVVFEDLNQASTTGPIAAKSDRDAAQKLADALNKALQS